jgi:hypothetical protein
LKTYLNASKALGSITETHIARKMKVQSRWVFIPDLYLTVITLSPIGCASDFASFVRSFVIAVVSFHRAVLLFAAIGAV